MNRQAATMTLTGDDDIRKSDRFIPWYFVAFFLVFIVVDACFVYIATTTHTGVVTKHAYEEGRSYNDTVKAADAQAELGWTGDIAYTDGRLSFSLTGKDGQPLAGAKVHATFMRPTQDGEDFTAALEETAPGTYSKHIEFPLPGQWDARLYVTWQQETYQQHRRLIVTP